MAALQLCSYYVQDKMPDIRCAVEWNRMARVELGVLRQKIGEGFACLLIHIVPSAGYTIREPKGAPLHSQSSA
jgi:hypothetical protein